MTTPKVFVTRRLPTDLDALSQVATIDLWEERDPPPYEILKQRVQDCEGLLCLLTDRIDASLLDHAPRLKVISQLAVGYDNIDIAAATRRGIPVGHTPGVLTEATADLTWALLMAAARRVVEGNQFTHEGRWTTWEPDLLLGPDIAGANLGIVGLGRIGQAVARRASGFNMRVLYTAPKPVEAEIAATLQAEYVDLDTLLRVSDFVTIHAPLTDTTRHLFKRIEFEQMKPSAILINTSRGQIVDHQTLYQALTEGWIAAAALDVTDPEPLPVDHPLLSLPNVIVTPHIGSASRNARKQMADIAIANLVAGLQGNNLPHCVNGEVQPQRQ